MATEKFIMADSGAAAADYSSSQHYAMYHSAAEALTKNATQGGWCSGSLYDNPESGEYGTVQMVGIAKGEAGGTWAVGNPLTVNSSGKFVKALNQDDFIVARALSTATSGDVGTMFLSHEGYNSAFGAQTADGRGSLHLLRATYDFATDGGVVGTINLTETVPNNAVVVRGYYYVATGFTSGGSATVSIGINTDDAAGLLALTAIGSGFTAGWHECIQDGTAANFSTVTAAERTIDVAVAVADLTAGNMVIFLEYVIID